MQLSRTLNLCIPFQKDFGVNKYATKKTITQGLLDIALLTANASQLKFVLEVGQSHPYYVLLLTFLAVSITLQVSHALLAVLQYCQGACCQICLHSDALMMAPKHS
jgi:hypothetical protein